jgi:hypothetical protein
VRKKLNQLNKAFAFFIISPFLGLIQSFSNYKQKWAANGVWLFVIFFGYTMFKPPGMDSYRYVLELEGLYNSPVNWDNFVSSFYEEGGKLVDIYQPLITYAVSLFTNNGDILFAVYGIVFGYFYSRNIWLLLKLTYRTSMNFKSWILIFTFACLIGYWALNGVRMWTAAHIFFYGTFKYIVEGNRKGLLIAVSSVLVHFSFLTPALLLLSFFFIRVPHKISYIFYVGSFFVSQLNLGQLNARLEAILPAVFTRKLDAYTSESMVNRVARVEAKTSWFLAFKSESLDYFILIMLSTIYFSTRRTSSYNKEFNNLFSFALLFLTISNILSSVPSASRYLVIAHLFSVTVVFYFYIYYNNKLFNKWFVISIPLVLFYIIISIRGSLDMTSVLSIFGNPIIVSLVDFSMPIIKLFQ